MVWADAQPGYPKRVEPAPRLSARCSARDPWYRPARTRGDFSLCWRMAANGFFENLKTKINAKVNYPALKVGSSAQNDGNLSKKLIKTIFL
jgi:hypothetical protein